MYSSMNMIDIIARCGGYFKSSVIKDMIIPDSFYEYLKRKKELNPLFKRAHCHGELVYYLPPKYVQPFWNYRPNEVNEYGLFKSFALLRYYNETMNLPYTRELLRKTFPNHPHRTFNGVYPTIDLDDDEKVIIILDYFRTETKMISIINSFREVFDPRRSPSFHIVTPRDRLPLKNALDKKRSKEKIEVYSYPELRVIV